MTTATSAALASALLLSGLKAGLLFAFSCSVMPGLRRVDDQAFVATMRAINVAIINPWFVAVYAGAPLAAVTALAVDLAAGAGSATPWIAAGLGFGLVTLAITARVNLPLNRELEHPASRLDQRRVRFERPWIRANHVRTLASTAALGCFCLALAVGG
jgi:uncharacterized membrane protein